MKPEGVMFQVFRALILIYGPAGLIVGVTRLRNPDWRTTGWWKNHKVLGFLITGPPFLGPRGRRFDFLAPRSERFAGVIQVIVGTSFIVVGLISLVVAPP
jgi:hypothetical protein